LTSTAMLPDVLPAILGRLKAKTTRDSALGRESMKILGLPVLIVLMIPAGASAVEKAVKFDAEAWDLSNGQVVEHLGRQSIIGTAVLKDVEFENGIIEFDVAATEGRSYPGVFFRMRSPEVCTLPSRT